MSATGSKGGAGLRVALALGGTDRGRSGISTFVRSIVPGLRHGLEQTGGALLPCPPREDREAYEPALRGLAFRETPRALERPGPNALWHLLRAGALASRLGADVLLLPAANRRLTALSPIPTVAVVHDLAQLHVAAKFDPLRMFYARQVMFRAFARATELVAVSGATRADLSRALGCRPERIRLVPNGVDARRFAAPVESDPRVAAALAATGLAPPYVLYISRLEHPGKNHLRLLRAFARSGRAREHQLVLAGADFGAAAQLRAESARLGIEKRVRLLGFVSDSLLPGLLAGADAAVMVGLCEGFGLPALEALAAGRPLVAANSGALPEVTGELAALCDPLSEESIGAALERALGDEALRARSLAEGPLWAAARGWEKTAAGLLDACRAAAARET